MTKEELEEYMEKTQKEIDFLVEKSFRDDLSEEDISNLSKEIYTYMKYLSTITKDQVFF